MTNQTPTKWTTKTLAAAVKANGPLTLIRQLSEETAGRWVYDGRRVTYQTLSALENRGTFTLTGEGKYWRWAQRMTLTAAEG